MADTTNYTWPLIADSQSQKHVTANEATVAIDAQLKLVEDIAAPVSASGAYVGTKVLEETLSALSGASVPTTIAFPAGSIIIGVSVRVTTAITGATDFDVGDGTTVDLFGSAVDIALSTTNAGAIAGSVGSGETVTLTANGGSFTAGEVKVALHYLEITPPTA